MLIDVCGTWINPETITSILVTSSANKEEHAIQVRHKEGRRIQGEWLESKDMAQLEVNELAENVNKILKELTK